MVATSGVGGRGGSVVVGVGGSLRLQVPKLSECCCTCSPPVPCTAFPHSHPKSRLATTTKIRTKQKSVSHSRGHRQPATRAVSKKRCVSVGGGAKPWPLKRTRTTGFPGTLADSAPCATASDVVTAAQRSRRCCGFHSDPLSHHHSPHPLRPPPSAFARRILCSTPGVNCPADKTLIALPLACYQTFRNSLTRSRHTAERSLHDPVARRRTRTHCHSPFVGDGWGRHGAARRGPCAQCRPQWRQSGLFRFGCLFFLTLCPSCRSPDAAIVPSASLCGSLPGRPSWRAVYVGRRGACAVPAPDKARRVPSRSWPPNATPTAGRHSGGACGVLWVGCVLHPHFPPLPPPHHQHPPPPTSAPPSGAPTESPLRTVLARGNVEGEADGGTSVPPRACGAGTTLLYTHPPPPCPTGGRGGGCHTEERPTSTPDAGGERVGSPASRGGGGGHPTDPPTLGTLLSAGASTFISALVECGARPPRPPPPLVPVRVLGVL